MLSNSSKSWFPSTLPTSTSASNRFDQSKETQEFSDAFFATDAVPARPAQARIRPIARVTKLRHLRCYISVHWQYDQLTVPYAPLCDHVIRHMLHVPGRTFQDRDLQASPGVQMHVQR